MVDAGTVAAAMAGRRGRPLFLIDIAVPRDVDPEVRGLDNVFLFDIDDLEGVVSANRREREGEIRRVQAIVEEELAGFLHWLNSLGSGAVIRALQEQASGLRSTELDRWSARLGQLPEDDRALVERILRGYANKLLHQPLVQIRELSASPDGHLHLDTVRRLFDLSLEEEDEERTS